MKHPGIGKPKIREVVCSKIATHTRDSRFGQARGPLLGPDQTRDGPALNQVLAGKPCAHISAADDK
jgi:hypothetical protein